MIHIDEFTGEGGQNDGQISMQNISDACTTLIRYVMAMASNNMTINVSSTNGGNALVTVKIIDCDCGSDKPESST